MFGQLSDNSSTSRRSSFDSSFVQKSKTKIADDNKNKNSKFSS